MSGGGEGVAARGPAPCKLGARRRFSHRKRVRAVSWGYNCDKQISSAGITGASACAGPGAARNMHRIRGQRGADQAGTRSLMRLHNQDILIRDVCGYPSWLEQAPAAGAGPEKCTSIRAPRQRTSWAPWGPSCIAPRHLLSKTLLCTSGRRQGRPGTRATFAALCGGRAGPTPGPAAVTGSLSAGNDARRSSRPPAPRG